MNLHHADKPDWEKQPPDSWNVWQRLAARTQGVITPANFVSLAGVAMVITGLVLITVNSVLLGTLLVIIGRMADILDGIVAEMTHTKSPLGELIDATIDKMILLAAIVVLALDG